MKAIFRFIRFSLLLSAAIVGAVGIFFFFMHSVWSPPTRHWLEQKISSAFLGPAHIGDLRLTHVWPLTLSFRNLRIEGPALKMVLELEQLDLGLSPSWEAVRLSVRARQGSLSLTTSPLVEAAWIMAREDVAKSPQRTSYPADQLVSLLPVHYDLRMENLALNHEDPRLPFPLHLENLNAHIRNLDSHRLRVEAKSDLALPEKFLGLKMPIQVDLPQLDLVEGGMKLPKGYLWVFGMGLDIRGQQMSAPVNSFWEATLRPVDLSKLPVLPSFLPAGDWRGPVKAEAKWQTKEKTAFFSGAFELRGAQGRVDMEMDGLKVKGSLKTSARVVIPESGGEILPQIDFQVDGGALNLAFKDWLKKPDSVPLQAFVQAAYHSGALILKPSHFRLGSFIIVSRGRLDMSDQKGGLDFELKKTRLQGAEALFPLASGYPLSGAIGVKARVTQNGEGLENLNVNVESFSLEQVATEIRWPLEGNETWVKGPIQLSLGAKGHWDGTKVASAEGEFKLNLSQTEVSHPAWIHKKKGWPLRVAGRAGMDGQHFRLFPVQAQFPQGFITLRGKVGQKDPRALDLSVQIQGVRMQDLLGLWPGRPQALNVAGKMGAALDLTGEFDSRMGVRSPLQASGNVTFNMEQVSWATTKSGEPSQSGSQHPRSESPPLIKGPLIPEGMLGRQSHVTLQGQVGQVKSGSFRAGGVALRGRLSKGVFQGDVSVQQVFNGSVQMRKMQLALMDPQVKTSFLMQAQNLKVGQFLRWVLPEYAGRGDGLLSFKGQINLPLDAILQELSRVQGDISFQLEKGDMDSQWLLGRVTQALKNKGLPLKVPPPSRLKFISQGQGQIKNGEIHFAQWMLETSQRDQVVVKGKVGLDLQADLSGTIYLAQAPLGGAIAAANRDGDGRLVLPFVWKGSVLDPNLSIAQSAVAVLLQKTAEAEAKKFLKEKVEKNIRKSLDRELKKLLGN